MTQEPSIFPPDYSLKQKIGTDVRMEDILTSEVVEEAQKVVEASSGALLNECNKLFGELKKHVLALPEKKQEALKAVIIITFTLKISSGMAGYTLASFVAKSLQNFCEKRQNQAAPTEKDMDIIRAHIEAIGSVFEKKILGDGGPTGQAIIAELTAIQ